MVNEIQKHSKFVIERCYEKFIIDSKNPEYREYIDNTDQIREVLIHENYLSKKDVEICISYDIAKFSKRRDFNNIKDLHDTLKREHGSNE